MTRERELVETCLWICGTCKTLSAHGPETKLPPNASPWRSMACHSALCTGRMRIQTPLIVGGETEHTDKLFPKFFTTVPEYKQS